MVNQVGLFVDQDKLCFDFSYKMQVILFEIKCIEEFFNVDICKNFKVYVKDVVLFEVREINGFCVVFGEMYFDFVRVVFVGVFVEEMFKDFKNFEWCQFSVEFCGGIYVDVIGFIKDLIIVEESGIVKGIRCIVVYMGVGVYQVQ